jgi:hypothetical protein
LPTELNRTFSKEEVKMAKKIHQKMHTIPGHKGNANQNHTIILPHSSQNSKHQEHDHQQMQGKGNSHTLLEGM